MEISRRINVQVILPLPIYRSVTVGEMAGDGEVFDLVVGLDADTVKKLTERSLDATDEGLGFTSDRKRFGEGLYEAWYAKGRIPFALLERGTKALAAVAWIGPKPLGRKSVKHLSQEENKEDERHLDSGEWHTVSYRSYAPFRGKGLMKDFVAFAMEQYLEYFPESHFWVSWNPANAPAGKLAEKLGFTIDEEASDRANNWIVLTKC